MIKNLTGYEPEEINFVLPKVAEEKFPTTIFDGAENVDEVIKIINSEFVALFPEDEIATRKLDDFEITETREEYCLLQENEMPKRIEELQIAIDQAKAMKKNAEDRLEALRQQIAELAAKVKDGTKEYRLPATTTARIALGEHYLYYAWVSGKMQLVKAEKIPDWDKRSLWSQDQKNCEAMERLFGYKIEAMVKPEGADEPDFVSDDEEDDDF